MLCSKVLLELHGVVTLVTIDDKQSVCAHFFVSCVLIEVLDPM
jgi:hypothetical protein